MKRLNIENRKKLKSFMEQQENMMGIVMILSMLSYFILFTMTRSVITLMCGYVLFYVGYTKLYKYIYFKLFRNDCK